MTMAEARRDDRARAKRLKDEGDALGNLVALIKRVVGAADAVSAEIGDLRASRDEALADVEDARSERDDELGAMKCKLEDAIKQVDGVHDRIEDLVFARRALRVGDAGEALRLIDRALDFLDPAWRTRG